MGEQSLKEKEMGEDMEVDSLTDSGTSKSKSKSKASKGTAGKMSDAQKETRRTKKEQREGVRDMKDRLEKGLGAAEGQGKGHRNF